MVDLVSRYCAAAVVKDKKARPIIDSFFRYWICLFGAPSKILTGNGCEFNNSEMRRLGESFNIKVFSTAAESPWSNMVFERLNGVLGDIVTRIIANNHCEVDIALAWAVSVRKSLDNHSGFSPNQFVFGAKPAFPNFFTSKIPALKPVSASDLVRETLNAMQSARVQFLKFESLEKVKTALEHNTRQTLLKDLQNGDEVYYKRNDSKEWHGPGVVIGKDGKQVLVRHGGIYVRVHMCRLSRTVGNKLSSTEENRLLVADSESERKTLQNTKKDFNIQSLKPVCDCDEIVSAQPSKSSINTNSVVSRVVRVEQSDAEEDEGNRQVAGAAGSEMYVGTRFQGVDPGTGELVSATIVSRAGKAKGKFKHCYNVRYDSNGHLGWLGVSQIENVKIMSNDEETHVLFNSSKVVKAKDTELENWKQNEVVEEVDCEGQPLISTRWVITEKVKNDEVITKARLVARGFEEDTVALRKDFRMCSREAVKITIAVASSIQ